MCGIWGVIANRDTISGSTGLKISDDLFRLSESRGKESAGIAFLSRDVISIYKQAIAASKMILSREYRAFISRVLNTVDAHPWPLVMIGHSRLVTNGSQESHGNNQPVVKDGIVAVHNGIIVNDEALWGAFPMLQRTYQVDTEVLLALIRHFYVQDLAAAVCLAFQQIQGTASIAAVFDDLDAMVVATNNGSLYACTGDAGDIYIFASEEYILKQLIKKPYLRSRFAKASIHHVEPGFGYIINLLDLSQTEFSLDRAAKPVKVGVSGRTPRSIVDETPPDKRVARSTLFEVPTVISSETSRRFDIDPAPIRALRRCTRCVLPETMPFIEFDEHGVCNYCRNYRPIALRGEAALRELAGRYWRADGRPDCLITFSGGRDSSFCLHYVKTQLDLHPVAYTYDWGMVTDLARRNQARLCGKLGVEHILVSADIARKRANIRRNVLAWLRRPDLGTVPLFMAGDKQYFYHANRLRKQLGIELVILGENLLETTHFKSGFCGIPPNFGSEHTYTLSMLNKVRLAFYYAGQYARNPAYINRSLLDTLGAFASYYLIPHEYVNLYNYVMWDERIILPTLIREYDWETAFDTRATWRIGDGTAAFYNYIYYCVAGLSENDTFRSNQIREGMLTREAAMATLEEENRPRFESIQWYCNTIGIDMNDALERIQAMPKLYPVTG